MWHGISIIFYNCENPYFELIVKIIGNSAYIKQWVLNALIKIEFML